MAYHLLLCAWRAVVGAARCA